MVELQGLEPWTSSMPWKRSSQLSYSPTILTLGRVALCTACAASGPSNVANLADVLANEKTGQPHAYIELTQSVQQ